jgi:hypothetical protein
MRYKLDNREFITRGGGGAQRIHSTCPEENRVYFAINKAIRGEKIDK